MEKERMESLIIDYIDNRLNTAERQLVEQELMRNEEAKKLYDELRLVIAAMEQSTSLQPSRALEENFRRDLRKLSTSSSGNGRIFFTPGFYRIAATVALVVVSGVIGYWISRNSEGEEQLAEMQRQVEITRQELAETKALMLGMIDNSQSASQRLRGVNVALALPKADNEIVDVLFSTMQSDPNTNVRLAALEALANFSRDPDVRRGLIQALPRQTNPMVQIRLIQLMVQMNEKAVVDDLQKMVDDAGTTKAVKDEAYSGILKLS